MSDAESRQVEIHAEYTRRQLEADAEHLMNTTGWGLAKTWGLIRAGQYAAARQRLNRVESIWRELDGSIGDDIDRP